MSLSIPLGPRVVLTASTIAWQALMLEMTCCLPLAASVPSLRSNIWGCIIVSQLTLEYKMFDQFINTFYTYFILFQYMFSQIHKAKTTHKSFDNPRWLFHVNNATSLQSDISRYDFTECSILFLHILSTNAHRIVNYCVQLHPDSSRTFSTCPAEACAVDKELVTN